MQSVNVNPNLGRSATHTASDDVPPTVSLRFLWLDRSFPHQVFYQRVIAR
jgi:hypothetical protein